MKNIHNLIVFAHVLVAVLLLTACQTIKTADADQVAIGCASIRFTVSQGVGFVLDNNPDYKPAVEALSLGISGVLLAEGGVTDAAAGDFIAGIARKYPLDAKTQQRLARVIVDAYQFYVDTFKPTVSAKLDPSVSKLISAFQSGVDQAIDRAKQ